mmetsp:Transcript_15974/g.27222  ORF Transcript_15974/g.27222 Transcript_15974/m.27222 type:complete len:210 (+) Transcript_15974:95-724(+)
MYSSFFVRNNAYLLGTNITLLLVHLCHILINISQNKLNRLLEVWHIPHFELGSIPQEQDHVSIPEQSLDRSDLHNVGVDNLGHVLSANARGDAHAAVGDSVSYPGLTGPCGRGRNDSHNSDDGEGGGECFRDGRGTLVEGFFRGKCGGRFGRGGCGGGVTSLSLSSLGLGSTPSHLLNSIKCLIRLVRRSSVNISNECGLFYLCHKSLH